MLVVLVSLQGCWDWVRKYLLVAAVVLRVLMLLLAAVVVFTIMVAAALAQQKSYDVAIRFQYAVAEDRGFIEAGWIPALRQGLACRKSCRSLA